ncbi:MAG: polysaccharide biosynthesis protein [Clostridiales bacterium]|jgi:stage V sporulation protein B|nr:polysaccharide biosynthesis protein [Clostridiales bacterium]
MKQQDFFRGATILAFAGFVTKLLGAVYRIPLTNIIGAEAMGIYQLIFSVYALFLTTSTGGLPAGLSKLIAETRADGGGDAEVSRIAGSALGLTGLTSLLFVAALVLFARAIASVQGNSGVYSGYAVIAPAIFFVGIISVMRGWFQGGINMTPTALSQIAEQVIKLGVGLALAAVLIKKGALYGAIGALAGVVAAELAAAAYLYVLFLKSGGRLEIAVGLKQLKQDFKKVAKYSIPITIGGMLMPLTQFADSFLVINILNKAGFALNLSTSLYGILTGPVSSMINLPVVVTISLAVVIIPVVSRQRLRRNVDEILSKSRFAIKTALFIGVPSAILFVAFSDEIMGLLYPNFQAYELAAASTLLKISSAGIVFLAAMQIITALLQALDRRMLPIRNLAVAMAVKIAFNIVLIRAMGITGAALSTVISYFCAAALNFLSLGRLIGFNKRFLFAALKTLTAGAAMAGFVLFTKNVVTNVYLRLFVVSALAAILYILISLFIGLFSDEEIEGFPLGKYIMKFKRKQA